MKNKPSLTTFTANIKSEALSAFMDDIDKVILKSLLSWYEAKGHWLTGKLINDISTDVTLNRGEIIIEYMAYKYGAYLNSGVKASEIPYRIKQKGQGKTGKGQKGIYRTKGYGQSAGHSLFIDGLIRYVQQRMKIKDLSKAKSIAFAIATNQKKHGMPRKTEGEGSKWIDSAIKEAEPELENIFETLSEDFITQNLTQIFNEPNNK